MARDMVFEDVPRLSKREGDSSFAGANNSTLLLGRDRLGSVDSGQVGPGTGAAHLIVGRKGADPSIADDAATLYLSAKSDPDTGAGTSTIGTSAPVSSVLIARADCVRIVPRQDIKIAVGSVYLMINGSSVVIGSNDISLGNGAGNQALLGSIYRANESIMNTAAAASATTQAAMATALAAFPLLSPIAAPCTAAATAATNLAAAVSAFESSAPSYISKIVKLG